MAALVGMKQICDYTSRSEATVLSMIRDYRFPAKKINGSWLSDTTAIDDWLVKLLAADDDEPLMEKPVMMKKGVRKSG